MKHLTIMFAFVSIALITKPFFLHGEHLNFSSKLEAAEGIAFDKPVFDQHELEKEMPARPASIDSLTVPTVGPEALDQTETQQAVDAPLGIISLGDKIASLPSEEEDEEDQDTRRLNLASSDDGAQVWMK